MESRLHVTSYMRNRTLTREVAPSANTEVSLLETGTLQKLDCGLWTGPWTGLWTGLWTGIVLKSGA